jgi:hypothetical protein
MHFINHRAFLAIILAIGFTLPAILTHGAEISEVRGAMGLSHALKRPDIIGRVLHSGAHPEDENSALLAWLARGQGVRSAYRRVMALATPTANVSPTVSADP